jgi:hypothetical protein
MDVKIHKFGQPSKEAQQIADKLSNYFSNIDELLDDKRTQEIIKSIQIEKFVPRVKYPGVRMDVVLDQIGIVAVMGNMANIAARCFSSIYHANSGEISEQIFVAHGPANAWWREYRNNSPSDWKYGTGNRLSSHDLRKMIDELYPDLMKVPIIIISLETDTAIQNYLRYCKSKGRTPIRFP